MSASESWTRIDASDGSACVRLLDAVGSDTLRDVVLDRLGLRDGDRVLDVGCGTGDAAAAAARRTRSRACAVDLSLALVSEAAARWSPTVDVLVADGRHLPFVDGSFDACRVERVLQHVREPGRVLDEMVRTLRPGGRVVALEPDWDGMIVDHPDRQLTDAVCRVIADGIRNPRIGRGLFGMFSELGLERLTVDCVGGRSGFVWFGRSPRLRAAADGGRLDGRALDAWLAAGEAADRQGRFLAMTPAFVVGGTKAHP